MFGYVTPLTEELRVKEHIFYKSVYCGLCRTMGKRVCGESRMTLSYDIVFLALVRMAITGDALEFKKGRCLTSPAKKRVFLKPNRSLEYSAAAGALLAYHNIADNATDSKGVKRAAAKAALIFSRRMRKRAGLTELDSVISEKLEALARLEKGGDSSIDVLAEKFGELLSEVFSYGLEGIDGRVAAEIGYHVGRWIYIVDAVDDFDKDKKQGEFNPLEEVNVGLLRCSMRLELEAVSGAIALISCEDQGINNIIENIIYLGMPSKIEKVLSKYSETDKGKESQE